jgi:N-methylhydantoinase B/oxoprolinase/acetone carboxylase alpha subunit
MCNAKYPGATSGATQTPTDTMGDVVHKAMASAIPDKVVAGGVRSSHMPIFAGVDERTGEGWSGLLVNGSGGAGAGKGVDGWPLWVGPAGAGGCKSMQIEQIELIYPILVTHEEIEPNSMGAGTWIGGPGVRFATEPTHGPMEAVAFGDGQLNPPHGVCGGSMGCGGGQYVEEPSGHRRYMSVTANYRVEMGDLRVGISTGGGGYGNPNERDAETVRENVRDGWFTREVAAEVFGVVLSDDWDPVIDEEATRARRAELAKIERPLLDPPGPAASTWLEGDMREGDVYLLNPEVG